MSDISVRAENLGKWYRIGERAHDRNVREAVNAALIAPYRMLRRRERPSFRGRVPAPSIWALRNVSFELRQGELLGIGGVNGAGTRTLLKIFPRSTEHT